jgi:hypothetical protein
LTFPANVRRAIYDRVPPRARGMKPGSATTSIVVRLEVDSNRVKNIGGRERQLNLTDRELSCLQPLRITLFSNKDARRKVRLIINRRRAYLLSVTETGIIVFSYTKIG